MIISSLIVETLPDYTEAVAAQLPDLPGVEVHAIVITIEAPTVDDGHDIASQIIPITGVLNVNLVYLNFEDDKSIYPDGV